MSSRSRFAPALALLAAGCGGMSPETLDAADAPAHDHAAADAVTEIDAAWDAGSRGDRDAERATPDAALDARPDGAGLDASARDARADVVTADRAPAGPTLTQVLSRLGGECPRYSPGTVCGLAVQDLATGARASFDGARAFNSASSAKFVWVAAAVHDRGVAPVSPYARPIFAYSDNSAAGSVIDLLASPARINTFMWNLGMEDSAFCKWNYERTRVATNCPAWADNSNRVTASDAVVFLAKLWSGAIVAGSARATLLQWSTLSPRTGYGGWIGTQLPATVRPTLHHKAGWLPPDVVPGYALSNEIGIVETGQDRAYAVATLMDRGTSYNTRQLKMMEYVSCVIYHAMVRDRADPFAAGCTHP